MYFRILRTQLWEQYNSAHTPVGQSHKPEKVSAGVASHSLGVGLRVTCCRTWHFRHFNRVLQWLTAYLHQVPRPTLGVASDMERCGSKPMSMHWIFYRINCWKYGPDGFLCSQHFAGLLEVKSGRNDMWNVWVSSTLTQMLLADLDLDFNQGSHEQSGRKSNPTFARISGNFGITSNANRRKLTTFEISSRIWIRRFCITPIKYNPKWWFGKGRDDWCPEIIYV